MFINTFNSADPEIFDQFLNARCTKDVKYLRTLKGQAHESIPIDHEVRLVGREAISQLWIHTSDSIPDVTFILRESFVCTYNTTANSKVVANLTAYATGTARKVPSNSNNNNTVNTTHNTDNTNINNNINHTSLPPIGEKRKLEGNTEIAANYATSSINTPTLIDCDGKLILHINADMQIDAMEFFLICNYRDKTSTRPKMVFC